MSNLKEIFNTRSMKVKPGNMFIKGIIHFTDDNGGFEVLQEDFFNNRLEKNGHFLNQHDYDITLEYSLRGFDLGIEPKAGEVYGILWNFNLIVSEDYSYGICEYDSEIETVSLKFELFDKKKAEELLTTTLY